MYGQFVREIKEDINESKSWNWVKNSDLKSSTTALIFSAQEQALRTNYTKFHIDKTSESPLCRLCGIKGESISHIISECSKLAENNTRKNMTVLHKTFIGTYNEPLNLRLLVVTRPRGKPFQYYTVSISINLKRITCKHNAHIRKLP